MARLILRSDELGGLGPYVRHLWFIDNRNREWSPGRELSLPGGSTHIVFRLNGEPLRVFDSGNDSTGVVVGTAIVGGPRARSVMKDVNSADFSIGAVLKPGAEKALLGVEAGEISGRHEPLGDVIGRSSDELENRLADLTTGTGQVEAVLDFLKRRVRPAAPIHPAVAAALTSRHSRVGPMVKSSGFSHRHFISVFRRAVGLSPKEFLRLRRFKLALRELRDESCSMAEVAYYAGYADHAHFSREFREITGVAPSHYTAARPESAYHLRILTKS